MMVNIPNIRILAVNIIVHVKLSHGIISVPVRYKHSVIGQHRDALIKPNIVNVNATCDIGGSPITLRNMTCIEVERYAEDELWCVHLLC